jgi:hypothetical protein
MLGDSIDDTRALARRTEIVASTAKSDSALFGVR